MAQLAGTLPKDPRLLAKIVPQLLEDRNENSIITGGVVIVDVKLDSLHSLFEKVAKEFNGYICLLDRNNRFLSYPDKDEARIFTQEGKPQTLSYVTTDQMVSREPGFASRLYELRFQSRSPQVDMEQRKNLVFQLNIDTKLARDFYSGAARLR